MLYLVVTFDRYDTHKSTNQNVVADSPQEALIKTSGENDEEFASYVNSEMKVVDPTFSCLTEDETDYLVLVYTL